MNLVSANFLLSNVGGLLSRRHQKFEFQEEDHRNRGGEQKMPGWLLDSASSPFSRARSVFHHHRQKLVGSVKNGIDASGNNKKNPTLPPAARVIEHKIDVEGSASSHRTVTEHIVQVIRETTPEVIESDGKWKGKETTITYPKSPISSDGSSPTGTLTGIDAELDADVDVDSSSIFADSDFNSADEAEVFGNVVITEVDDDGCPEAVSSDWMSSLSRSVEMKSEVSGPVSTEKFGSNSPTLSVSRNCSLPDLDFLALQPLFALDHTPAKSKSSVARSGSHSGRKPPSRLNSVPGSSISGSGGGGGGGNFEDSGGGTAHDFLFAKWSSSGVGLDVGKLAADAGRCSGEHHVVVTSATASPVSSFKVENNYQLQSFADFRQCVKEFQDETIEIGRQRIDELHQANNHHQEVVTKNQVTYATVNRAEKLEKSDAVSVSSLLSKSNTDIDEPSWRRELKSRRSLRGSASCNSSSIAVDSRSASPTPSSASWLSEIWHRSTPLAERIRKNSVHDLTGGSSPTPNGSNNDGAGAEASPSSSSRVSRRPSAFNARKTIENRRQQTNGPATVTAPAPRSASEPRDKNVKLSLGGSLEKSKSLSSLEQESQKDETETLLTKSASSPTLERERTKVHSYLFGTSIANQLDYHLEESAASSRNSIAGSLAGESQKFNRNDERRRTYAFEKSMDDHIQTSIDYLKSREESSENEESPFWKNEVKLRSTPQRQRLLNGDVEPSSKRTILELGTSRGVVPSEKMTNPHPVVIKIDRYENRHPASSSSSSNSALEMTRNAEERRSLREKGPFLSKVMLRRSSQSPERQPAPPPPTFKAPPEARVEIVSKDEPKPHREKTKELMKLLDSAPKLNPKKESTSKSEENVTGDSLPRPGMPFNVKLRHVVSPGPKEDFDFPAYDFNKPNYLEMIPDLAGKDLTVVESEGTPKPQPKSILKRRSVDNILDDKSMSNGVPPWLEAVQRRNTATVDWNDLENKAGKAEEPKRVSWLEEIVLKKTDTNPSSEDEKEPGPKTYLFGETQETVHSSKLTPPREVTIVESEPVKPQPPATRESLVQKLKISFDQGPEAMKVVQHSDSSSGNVVVKISPTSDGPPIVDIAGSSDQSMPIRPSAFKLTNRVEIIENSKNPSADSDEPAAVEKPVADHLPSTAPVSSHLSTAQHHENNRTNSNHDMDLSVMKHLTSIRLNSEAAPPASLAKEVQPGAVAPCATNAARPISTVIADLKSTSPERKPVVDLKSDAIPGRSTNLRAKLPASLVTPGAPLRLFDRRELDRLSLRETKKKHENESSSPRNRFSADFETKPVTKSASNLLHLLPQAPSKSKLLSQLEEKLKPVAAAQQRSSSSSSSKTENTKKLENEYATIGKTDSDSEIGFKRRSSTGRNVPEHLRRKKSGDGDKTYDDPWDVKTKPAHNGVGTQHLESSAGKSKEKGARKPAVPSLTQRTPRACRRASNESENSDVTLGNRNNNKQPAVRKFEHPCTDVRIPLASANPVKGRYEKHTPRVPQNSSRSQPQVPRRTSLERPFSKDKPSSQRSKSAVALRKTGVTRRSTDKLLALVKSAANNVSGSVSSDSSRRVRKRDSGKSTVSSKSSNSSLLSVASHNARNDGSVARPSRKDRRYPNGTESGDEDFTYIDLSKTKKSGLLTSLEQVQDQLKTRQERATRDENLKQRLSDIIDREKSRLRSISASPSRNKSPEDRRRFLFGEKSILEEEEVAEKPKTASPKRKATRKCSLDDILKSNAFVDVEPPERSVSRMSTASRSSAGHEFLVSTLNKSGALTALGDKYRLSSSKYDENEDKFNRSRLASDASTVSEFPASGGMKFSLDNENNIVVEAFDHKPSKAVVIEELTDDVRDDKAETGRRSSGPLRILETVPDFAMAPLQNGDYVSKRHLMLAALSNEGPQPKITEPDSELDVSLNGHEPNKNQLIPSSVQRKTEASSGGTKYVTRTVTTSPQGHTTVTTEGVKNRTMATREILSDGPWSGVREVKGAQDQRLTVEECTKGGSKISRVVTQTHSSRSILTITKLSRR